MGKEKKKFITVSDLVLESLKMFKAFSEEFASFKKIKKCDFERIDKLEQDLYDLKNLAHYLFRENAATKEGIQETHLYDLIISSIFHEMLHLKEYIYILDRYEPQYLVLEKRFEDEEIDEFKKDFLRHSREMVGEAKLGLPLKMQGINELVKDALPHLSQIVKMNSFDSHLMRMLYVYSDIVDKLYVEGIKVFYDGIYEGGWVEGFFLVAESFIKSGFHDEAREILQKIIDASSMKDNSESSKIKKDYTERAKIEIKNL